MNNRVGIRLSHERPHESGRLGCSIRYGRRYKIVCIPNKTKMDVTLAVPVWKEASSSRGSLRNRQAGVRSAERIRRRQRMMGNAPVSAP
jgi:hypothetical protein